MVAEWFVLSNGESIGPYSQDQIVGLIQEGSLSPMSYVRRLDGPWITIAEAFMRMVAAASSQSVGGTSPPAIPAPEPIAAYASTTSPPTFRYRRKKSSHLNLLMTIAAIAVGGAAAIYTAKSLLTGLTPKAVEESEPEVVVVQRANPAPKRPTVDRPSGPRQTRTPIEEVPNTPVVAPKPTTPPEKQPPLPVPVSPVEDVKPDQATITWLSTLESIHARRDSLMLKIAAVVQKGSPLEDQAKTIDAECRPKEKAISELRQANADLSNEKQRLFDLAAVSNDSSYAGTINRLQGRIDTNISTMGTLNTVARRIEYRKLMSQINTLKEEYLSLLREADNLRAELVFHLNPFTAASEPIAKAGLSYFSRPIDLPPVLIPSVMLGLR